MSAWDEMDEPVKVQNPDSADAEAQGAAAVNQQSDYVDDGFGGDPNLDFDPAMANSQDEVVENVAVKKKGLSPIILAGILGLGTVSLVGYFGLNLYNKLKPKRVAPPTAITQEMTPLQAPIPPVTMFDDSAAPAGAVAPVVPAVVALAPAVVVTPTAPAPAPVAAPTTPSVAAAPVVVVDQQIQQQVVDLDKRMTSLEDGVGKLTEAVSRSQSKPAAAVKVAKAATTEGSAVPASRTKARTSKRHAKDKQKAPEVNEAPTSVAHAAQLPLQLRGVYPPHGEDRQAWVLDPLTGVITIISKGESIQGMNVVRVGSDYVLTNQGIIR